jgi:hypothetical protein
MTEDFRNYDQEDKPFHPGAISGQQSNVTAHMAYLARKADYDEAYWKNQAEGNKRMRAVVDAMPTANEKQVSGNHYKDMPIQPWAIMEAVMTPEEFIGFLKGNIIKYSLRAGRKEGSDDAGKAKHYMEKLNEIQGS